LVGGEKKKLIKSLTKKQKGFGERWKN
jgi:hypothetical protein